MNTDLMNGLSPYEDDISPDEDDIEYIWVGGNVVRHCHSGFIIKEDVFLN